MKTTRLSRRVFLKGAVVAGAGLTMGFDLAGGRRALAQTEPFVPNAWIRITPDDIVTVIVGKSDMGQGVLTSMPMLIAEELEADWSKIRTEQAPAAPQVYGNPAIGGMQLTGGSTSVRSSWLTLRQAGAAAKEMLVEAAARQWGVDPAAPGHFRRRAILPKPEQRLIGLRAHEGCWTVATPCDHRSRPQGQQEREISQLTHDGRLRVSWFADADSAAA